MLIVFGYLMLFSRNPTYFILAYAIWARNGVGVDSIVSTQMLFMMFLELKYFPNRRTRGMMDRFPGNTYLGTI